MSFDALLQQVGECGKYQIFTLIICSMLKGFAGLFTMLPVLSNSPRDYTCRTWSAGNDTWSESFPNATCEYPDNDTSSSSPVGQTPVCVGWNFSQTTLLSTIQSQYDLTCDYFYLTQLSVTIYFLGFMIGCPLYGRLADHFGRFPMILISSVNLLLTSAAAPLAPWFWLYTALRFLAGVGSGGILTTTFTLNIEDVSTPYRVAWGLLYNVGWALAIVIVAAVGYFERSHVRLQLYLCPPFLVAIIIVGLTFHESARWLLAVGKFERFQKEVTAIARRNGRPPPSTNAFKELYELRVSNDSETSKTKAKKDGEELSFLEIRRYPSLCKVLVIHWASWFVVSCGYYMSSLGIGLLGGNIYISLCLSGVMEIPSILFSVVVSRYVGRVALMSAYYLIGGLGCLVSALLVDKPHLIAVLIAVNLLGKLAFTEAFEFIWVYAAELFPTQIRNYGVGWGSTWARVGAMTSPLLLLLRSLWTPAPYLLLGAISCLISFATLMTPETRGRDPLESLVEGDRMCRRPAVAMWWRRCTGKKKNSNDHREDDVGEARSDEDMEELKMTRDV